MAPGGNQISFDSAIRFLTTALLEARKVDCIIRMSVSAGRIDQELDACTSIAEKTKLAKSHPEFLRAGIKFLTFNQPWKEHRAMVERLAAIVCGCNFRQAGMVAFHTFCRKPADRPVTAIFEAVITVCNFLILALADLTRHQFRSANVSGDKNWPQGPDDLLPSGLEGSVYGLRHWVTFPPDGSIVFKLIGSLALFYAPFTREVLHTENGTHLYVLAFMHLQAATKFYNEGDSSPSARVRLFIYPVKTIIEYFDTLQLCDTPGFNLMPIAHQDMVSLILTHLSAILSTLPAEWSKYRGTVNFMLSWANAKVDRATGLVHVKLERDTFAEEIERSDPLRKAFEDLTFARKMGCLNITCSSADEAIHSRLCSKCNLVRFCGEKVRISHPSKFTHSLYNRSQCQKEAWKYSTLPHKPLCAKAHSLKETFGADNWSLLWSSDSTYSDFKAMCHDKNIDVENVKAIGSTLSALKTAQKMFQDDLVRADASQIDRLKMAEQQKALTEHRKDFVDRVGRDSVTVIERKDALASMSIGAIHH